MIVPVVWTVLHYFPHHLNTANQSPFEQIVLPHLDSAYNVARWLTGNERDAEDVTQEACLRAFKFFSTFRGGDARAWLLAIIRRTPGDCYVPPGARPAPIANRLCQSTRRRSPMNCSQIAKLLQAHHDGELDAAHELQVEEHFADCPQCFAAARKLSTLRGALQN